MISDSVVRLNHFDGQFEARIERLLADMTLAEKIGQLVQVATFDLPDLDEIATLTEQTHPFKAVTM